jgi:hypothetical protein
LQAAKKGRFIRPLLSKIAFLMIVMCLVGFSAFAMTSDSFRCPNGSSVHLNDKLATVKMKCDPPTYSSRLATVEIEEWVYNLGPTSFMMYLTFTNGVLTNIESGEYGD